MNYKLLNYWVALVIFGLGMSRIFLSDSTSFAIPFTGTVIALYIVLANYYNYRGGIWGYIGCFVFTIFGAAFVQSLSYPAGTEANFLTLRNLIALGVGLAFVFLGIVRHQKLKHNKSSNSDAEKRAVS